MLKRIDNHNHIMLASLDSMIEAAQKHNVDHFSFTEHISQFTTVRQSVKFLAVHKTGRMFGNFKEYKDEFSKIDRLENPKVAIGLEVDYIPTFQDKIGKFVTEQEWDILLCSVHEFHESIDIEGKDLLQDLESSHRRWKEYYEAQKDALLSNFIPFNVLTHPVRLFASTPNYPPDLDNMMLELAELAEKKEKMLELNGKDLTLSSELVEKLARACSKAGCKVSLGSDAHYPDQVFRNMNHASELVARYSLETGFSA